MAIKIITKHPDKIIEKGNWITIKDPDAVFDLKKGDSFVIKVGKFQYREVVVE